MSKAKNKTRDEIVYEMVEAATACYQHYVDGKIPVDLVIALSNAIEKGLPLELSTTEYDVYCKYYAKQCRDEARKMSTYGSTYGST